MNDFNGNGHDEDSAKSKMEFSEITTDGIFSVKISEDMGIRNILRSGLVEAQGKDSEKIPMFVSWPHWLDDGIVCLFARDLHTVLADTVRNTIVTINEGLDNSDIGENMEDGASETVTGLIAEEDGNSSNKNNQPTHSKIIKGNKL